MTAADDFQSAEVATCWRYIASSLDRLVGVVQGLGEDDLGWRPPAPETNSLATLAIHTLGNAEENLLGVLCGRPVSREREAEFSATPPGAEIAARWSGLRARLEPALAALPAASCRAGASTRAAGRSPAWRCCSSSRATPPSIWARPS